MIKPKIVSIARMLPRPFLVLWPFIVVLVSTQSTLKLKFSMYKSAIISKYQQTHKKDYL